MSSLIRSHAYLRACKIFTATSSRYFRDDEVELQKVNNISVVQVILKDRLGADSQVL